MLTPLDKAIHDSCRDFASMIADADTWAGITQTAAGVEEVAKYVVEMVGSGTFGPAVAQALRLSAVEGYNARLQFLKAHSDRIGRL